MKKQMRHIYHLDRKSRQVSLMCDPREQSILQLLRMEDNGLLLSSMCPGQRRDQYGRD